MISVDEVRRVRIKSAQTKLFFLSRLTADKRDADRASRVNGYLLGVLLVRGAIVRANTTKNRSSQRRH